MCVVWTLSVEQSVQNKKPKTCRQKSPGHSDSSVNFKPELSMAVENLHPNLVSTDPLTSQLLNAGVLEWSVKAGISPDWSDHCDESWILLEVSLQYGILLVPCISAEFYC